MGFLKKLLNEAGAVVRDTASIASKGIAAAGSVVGGPVGKLVEKAGDSAAEELFKTGRAKRCSDGREPLPEVLDIPSILKKHVLFGVAVDGVSLHLPSHHVQHILLAEIRTQLHNHHPVAKGKLYCVRLNAPRLAEDPQGHLRLVVNYKLLTAFAEDEGTVTCSFTVSGSVVDGVFTPHIKVASAVLKSRNAITNAIKDTYNTVVKKSFDSQIRERVQDAVTQALRKVQDVSIVAAVQQALERQRDALVEKISRSEAGVAKNLHGVLGKLENAPRDLSTHVKDVVISLRVSNGLHMTVSLKPTSKL